MDIPQMEHPETGTADLHKPSGEDEDVDLTSLDKLPLGCDAATLAGKNEDFSAKIANADGQVGLNEEYENSERGTDDNLQIAVRIPENTHTPEKKSGEPEVNSSYDDGAPQVSPKRSSVASRKETNTVHSHAPNKSSYLTDIVIDRAGSEDSPPKHIGNKDTYDASVIHVMAGQQKEIERLRSVIAAAQREAELLRDRVIKLEVENSHLWWLQADKHGYRSRKQQQQQQLGDNTSVMKKLITEQSSELAANKDCVQKLQNELIKKNDREKVYIERDAAMRKKLQEMKAKCHEQMTICKEHEATCRKQAAVIKAFENDNNQQKAVLKDDGVKQNRLDELEKQLVMSRSRIRQLEDQLDENSRRWNDEKFELLLRMKQNKYWNNPHQTNLI